MGVPNGGCGWNEDGRFRMWFFLRFYLGQQVQTPAYPAAFPEFVWSGRTRVSVGAHHPGHSWVTPVEMRLSGSEDCRYTEVSPEFLSLQCCDYRENVEFLITIWSFACFTLVVSVGRGQRSPLWRRRWGAALWDPSLGVPRLLSSNGDKWPCSK